MDFVRVRLEAATAVIAHDVTAWEVIRTVLRVRLFWPLYGLLYLGVAMNLKMKWVEYRTRKGFADASARTDTAGQTHYPPPVSSAFRLRGRH